MAAAHIEHPNVAAATDFGRLPDGSFFLILEFVRGNSGEMIRSDIADAIAAGLDRMHLDFGKFGKNVGNLFEEIAGGRSSFFFRQQTAQ